jgi:hypothetical protein
MCYAGGPYCSKPALKKYQQAEMDYKENPTEENKDRLGHAKLDYLTTPDGIQLIRDSGDNELADKYAAHRELEISRAQERAEAKLLGDPNTDTNVLHHAAVNGHYHAKVAVANNPGISMRTLQHIVDNETEDDFRFAVARHPKATEEMVAWAAEHPSMRAKALALGNPNISRETIDKIRHDSRVAYMEAKEGSETVSPQQEGYRRSMANASLVWKKARTLLEKPMGAAGEQYQVIAEYVIPRDGDMAEYYKATDAKHFSDKTAPGSKFTDPDIKNLNDVVALAANQHPDGLRGDDRAKLIQFGCNPAALRDDCRYLIVQTPGKVGSQHISSLPVNEKIEVVRTKPGAPCSLVANVSKQPNVNFGVVVIGKSGSTGKDIVYTAHAGMPTRTSGKDEGIFDEYQGRSLSINHIMEIAGTDDINVNTRLV